eukprot:c20666_g1_i2 orf=776-2032(+)
MALSNSAPSDRSSYFSNRNWHSNSLHSWNIYNSRLRSRVPPEPPVSRGYSSRPIRGGMEHFGGVQGSPSSSFSASLRTNLGADIAHQRHAQGRNSEVSDPSFMGFHRRSGPTQAHHRQHHRRSHSHHHRHHHHHHYNHHQNLAHTLREDLEQGTIGLQQNSSGIFSEIETLPVSSNARNNGQYGSGFLSELSFINVPHEGVREARDRLDERLRSGSLISHRSNISVMPRNFLEESVLSNGDDVSIWNDREPSEMSVSDWLTEQSFEEWWSFDEWGQEMISSPERAPKTIGLSKAGVNSLLREVFVPNMSTDGKEDGDDKPSLSEQEDCSVCLEHFLPGQTLICLPCKHRFHPGCLTPWLECHVRCPYCRSIIPDKISDASGNKGASSHDVSQEEEDFFSWFSVVNPSLAMLNFHSTES